MKNSVILSDKTIMFSVYTVMVVDYIVDNIVTEALFAVCAFLLAVLYVVTIKYKSVLIRTLLLTLKKKGSDPQLYFENKSVLLLSFPVINALIFMTFTIYTENFYALPSVFVIAVSSSMIVSTFFKIRKGEIKLNEA